MPVMLHEEDYDRWLELGDPKNPPLDLLAPFPDELLKFWRIKPDVGNTRNNSPDLIDPTDPASEPADPPKPRNRLKPDNPDQSSLF